MSNHAQIRQQQRGIPQVVVDWLLELGTSEHTHDGAELLYFDKTARKRLNRYLGGGPLFSHAEEFLDSYAVVFNGKVVTVGHRYKRINRH
ncbi:MAG: hypothetical protein WDM70_09945 [Nitrosomonadales bacterium]